MDLLGDVGELEVGGEGPGEAEGRPGGDGRKLLGEPAAARLFALGVLELGHGPDLLDEIEELRTLGAGELLAEQRDDEADVATQGGVALLGRRRVVGGDGVAHVAANLGESTVSRATHGS